MIKKTIKYTDYDGNQREEEFRFNLSKAELTEMQLSATGGLSNLLTRLVQEKNAPEIIKILKEIILKSYGEKSDDGKYFRKSEEISKAFSETEAYSEIFMSIASDPDAAIEFVQGILPAEIKEELQKNQKAQDAQN